MRLALLLLCLAEVHGHGNTTKIKENSNDTITAAVSKISRDATRPMVAYNQGSQTAAFPAVSRIRSKAALDTASQAKPSGTTSGLNADLQKLLYSKSSRGTPSRKPVGTGSSFYSRPYQVEYTGEPYLSGYRGVPETQGSDVGEPNYMGALTRANTAGKHTFGSYGSIDSEKAQMWQKRPIGTSGGAYGVSSAGYPSMGTSNGYSMPSTVPLALAASIYTVRQNPYSASYQAGSDMNYGIAGQHWGSDNSNYGSQIADGMDTQWNGEGFKKQQGYSTAEGQNYGEQQGYSNVGGQQYGQQGYDSIGGQDYGQQQEYSFNNANSQGFNQGGYSNVGVSGQQQEYGSSDAQNYDQQQGYGAVTAQGGYGQPQSFANGANEANDKSSWKALPTQSSWPQQNYGQNSGFGNMLVEKMPDIGYSGYPYQAVNVQTETFGVGSNTNYGRSNNLGSYIGSSGDVLSSGSWFQPYTAPTYGAYQENPPGYGSQTGTSNNGGWNGYEAAGTGQYLGDYGSTQAYVPQSTQASVNGRTDYYGTPEPAQYSSTITAYPVSGYGSTDNNYGDNYNGNYNHLSSGVQGAGYSSPIYLRPDERFSMNTGYGSSVASKGVMPKLTLTNSVASGDDGYKKKAAL